MATNYDVFLPYSGETVTQAQWQDYINCLGADGVTTQLNGTSALAVVQRAAGANMSVDVSAGRILQQGMRAENSTTKNLVIAANASGNPRIDRIVSRWTPGSTDMELDVLQGTPAGSPTAPALTQNATTYEVSLAQIAVASGAVSIVTANITDERAWSGPQAVRIPSVASAATLNVNFYTSNPGWYVVPVTGTTTITAINVGAAGSVIVLEFASANCAVTNAGTLKLSASYTSTTLSTLTLYSDGTNWVELARSVTPGTATASLSNALVNGDFSVWQRGTSFANPANGAYLADRWQYIVVTATAQPTWAQSSSVPVVSSNSINTPYSLRMTIPATADATIGATDLYALGQAIEGFDYRALTNGFSASFWVLAHRTGTYTVAFQNNTGGVPDRCYVAEYTVSSADTWEYKTVTVPTPPTAGTWNYTNGQGLRVMFVIAAGTNFHTTPNAWQSSNVCSTANQVNGVGATTDVFSVALVNVVPGSTAYALNPLTYDAILDRCQRYYQILGDATSVIVGAGQCKSTTTATVPVRFCKIFGGTPTVTITTAANATVTQANGSSQACNAIVASGVSLSSCNLDCTAAAATLVAGNATYLFWAGAGGIVAAWNPA